MSIKNWSTTPGSNTATPPDGAPETSTKLKDFNDIIRQVMAKVRCLAAPVTIASAATTDLGASDETIQTISGVTTITSFGTVSAGIWKLVTFSGALTLTHNATSLILLTGANRTTVAGDCGLYVSLGSGNWKEYFYSPIGGYQPLDAQLTTLAGITAQQATDLASVSTFIGTLLNNADASTAQTTLGISAFIKTLIDDADATAARATLGIQLFESAQQTITSGGTVTIAHGLGAVPRIVQPWIICAVAENGYSVGDRVAVMMGTQIGTSGYGVNPVVDATNITIRYGNAAGSAFVVLNKTTGAPVSCADSSWRFIVTAYK